MNILNKLARIPEIATAVALISALVAVSAAAEIPSGKGGAQMLMKSSKPAAGSPALTMSCASCRDVFITRKDSSARGANQQIVTVAHHLCQSCSTTLRTSGQGKSVKASVEHQCMMAGTQDGGCCGKVVASNGR
jgi:hypothetical protein